jgi:YaaC-like protein
MPAPPKAREGTQARSSGRLVVAGVAPHAQILTSYSPSNEIWDALRILITNSGYDRLLKIHGPQFTRPVFAHFCAYLHQAETYYSTAQGMPAESRPLVAYYCLLNLTKALLACKAPKAITGKVRHGLTDDFRAMQRYRFTQEWAKIQRKGVFRDLATRTGAGYCHPDGKRLQLQRLSPYLVEVSSLQKEATGIAPKLLPAESIQVLDDGARLWLRWKSTAPNWPVAMWDRPLYRSVPPDLEQSSDLCNPTRRPPPTNQPRHGNMGRGSHRPFRKLSELSDQP